MLDVFQVLGIDPDEFEWTQLASCLKQEPELFFDKYESDPITARQVDAMCIHCPVAQECYMKGIETKSDGVWGGVYLNGGKVDEDRNAHKSKETWAKLSRIHDEQF